MEGARLPSVSEVELVVSVEGPPEIEYPIVHPVGGVTAFQLRFTLESVMPESANPVGVLGFVVHELADVVTLMGELAADVPAESVASTLKL